MSATEGRDPYEDYQTINQELEQYDERLMERTQLIVANKMDMPGAEEQLEQFKEHFDGSQKIFPISALTKSGLSNLLYSIADTLEKIPKNAFETQEEDLQDERVIYRHEKDDESFRITRDPDGAYVLTGPQIERLFKMTDFNRDESVRRFARQMRHLGIDEALRKRGAEDGDIVRLLDFEFEFVE